MNGESLVSPCQRNVQIRKGVAKRVGVLGEDWRYQPGFRVYYTHGWTDKEIRMSAWLDTHLHIQAHVSCFCPLRAWELS